MTITYHRDLVQGSEEWLAARCGMLTASEMKLIITPSKLQFADNDKSRAHLFELLSQRITGYVEPAYISDDMLHGMEDEIEARELYNDNHAPVTEVGFVTNDKFGFTLGYSPDGLIGEDGQIEIKSRRQKYQLETILSDELPAEYLMQIQTGLLVTERKWVDFVSYCGGLPLYVKRIYAYEKIQTAIVECATKFHTDMAAALEKYKEVSGGMVATVRRVEQEMFIGEAA